MSSDSGMLRVSALSPMDWMGRSDALWIIVLSNSSRFILMRPCNCMLSKTNGNEVASSEDGRSITWKCKCGASVFPEFPSKPIFSPCRT